MPQIHRILVTGGAGFLGSHLCETLLNRGDQVTCVDDFSTGRRSNIESFGDDPRFKLVELDVSRSLSARGDVDAVVHMASPASPPDYHRLPLQTLAVGSRGTENALILAEQKGARFVLASTSEVYGDPAVHPQREDYCGNVSSIGPRSVYDEAKRYAEAVSMAYARSHGVDVGIIRIFNTFGPRMRAEDGRVVSSFIAQALNHDPLTIYGDGSQTRSFCFVDDLVRGIVAMIDSQETGPINLGNPVERTVLELAEIVLALTESSSDIEFYPRPVDDPTRRQPDIGRAEVLLGWIPEISTEEGLRQTIEYFRSHGAEVAAAANSISGAQYEGDGNLQPHSLAKQA
jgi:dTDP-glucose 4,6-dehydratase